MKAWQILTEQEHGEVWKWFETVYGFRPQLPGRLPCFKEPVSAITYDVSAFSRMDESTQNQQALNLQEKTLMAFRQVVAGEGFLYVLDWQHDCYRFWPQQAEVVPAPETWKITVFPDGDFHMFLAGDLRFGLFGHPWDETICVFGEDLKRAYAKNQPFLFQKIIRVGGNPA